MSDRKKTGHLSVVYKKESRIGDPQIRAYQKNFFDRYGGWAMAVALRYMGSIEEAESVFEDALLDILQSRVIYEKDENVAKKALKDHLVKRAVMMNVRKKNWGLSSGNIHSPLFLLSDLAEVIGSYTKKGEKVPAPLREVFSRYEDGEISGNDALEELSGLLSVPEEEDDVAFVMAFQKLPVRLRTIYNMLVIDGYPRRDIAKQTRTDIRDIDGVTGEARFLLHQVIWRGVLDSEAERGIVRRGVKAVRDGEAYNKDTKNKGVREKDWRRARDRDKGDSDRNPGSDLNGTDLTLS